MAKAFENVEDRKNKVNRVSSFSDMISAPGIRMGFKEYYWLRFFMLGMLGKS